MHPLGRIIDANANRASEALRTLEDVARFGLEDAAASATVKEIRHALAAALGAVDAAWLVANRSVGDDPGVRHSTDRERSRESLAGIATAAGKRATEALRVLEESTKVVAPELAPRLEALRYRTYEVAASVARRAPGSRREQWRVCVLLTEALCMRPWRDVARAVVDGGADAIQLREKSCDGDEAADRAAWLVALARPHGVRVIVNDRVDVAMAANADGVHVGQADLSIARVRQVAGRQLMVGASTHDPDEARRAARDGADYCGVGAMFASAGKPSVAPRGTALLQAFVAAHPTMPHLAIGGVTTGNVAALVDVGCRGVAVSTCACGAERPDLVVARLRQAFDRVPAERTA